MGVLIERVIRNIPPETVKVINMATTKQTLTQSDLDQFTGTEGYHRLTMNPKFLATDGVRFLAERASAFWLVDAIMSHQLNPKLRSGRLREMQFWQLDVTNGKAVLTCRADSDVPPAITQRIPFTDFPLATVKVWVQNTGDGRLVALLPSEY
jgi:hypothetical protein